YYAARQLDAREWKGPMPFQLSFADSQADVIKKVGRRPDHVADDVFSGSVSWGFDDFVLTVVYSNVWNTVVRVMLRARSRASN
ncbi:MAG TPA: hypothetical protein VGG33_28045, partial [Polyangia bacterium]